MEPVRSVRSGSGWLVFASVILFIAGFHNLIYGISAFRNYGVLITTNGAVIYQDLHFWGWLLIAMGIVEIVTAAVVVTGKQWARWLAIVICGLNAIAQLAFLAVFPLWSVVVIALDVAVIYGLTRYDTPVQGSFEPYPESDRNRTRAERPGYSGVSRSSRSGPDVSAHG